MDQQSLYHGLADSWSPAAHGRPGSERYERWAAHERLLREVSERRRAARLERRRKRLMRRIAAIDSRVADVTRQIPPAVVAVE